jgi:translation initiation factor 2 subunit 1
LVSKKDMPEWGEFVLCTVTRITPYAAWCRLDEYPGREGMIHVSEVAGKWVHDIRDFVKENKQYIAKVVRIDQQKNFINLSLKRVTRQDEKQKMNTFRREQRADKMLEQAAKEVGKDMDEAYEEVGFLLQEKFGELFSAFEEIKESKEVLSELKIPKEWAKAISNVADKSFKEKETIIKADLEMKSYSSDGLNQIKEILKEVSKKTGAKVKYISAPVYRIEISTKDPKNAEKNLKEGLEEAIKQVKQLDGDGSYKLVR